AEFDRLPAPGAPRREAMPPRAAAPSASAPASRQTLPPIADAFAALLAAEQDADASSPAPVWPVSAASGAPISDDVVEQVTQRVLARLSDQVVRDTVADVVSQVAERLVREEIERIKGSIK